eukprot:SAG22_NODE_6773_length_812_cov_1.633941_1_plen_71_part_00
MAELRAALRVIYGGGDAAGGGGVGVGAPPPPPPAAGFHISAAEYLEILDELTEEELADAVDTAGAARAAT